MAAANVTLITPVQLSPDLQTVRLEAHELIEENDHDLPPNRPLHQLRYRNHDQPEGDGLHSCLRGMMRLVG